MNLKQEVCSRDFAKRFKELGVKQKSYFYWRQNDTNDKWEVVPAEYFMCDCDHEPEAMHACDIREIAAETKGGPGKYDPEAAYAAFTVAELGEMLPAYFTHPDYRMINLCVWKNEDGWTAGYRGYSEEHLRKSADTEADARAAMLVYLLEHDMIKANGGMEK